MLRRIPEASRPPGTGAPHPAEPSPPYLALSWAALAPSGTFPLLAVVSSLSTLIHSAGEQGLSGGVLSPPPPPG